MFWKVAGFSQPSSIEQLLDKNEFTLEELLDEDDIIQECKSLNGRLVAFLRERTTVDQLVRYLVEPALDSSDAKRAYKYPFTACEVLCCEIEAVFTTLVDDPELRVLLFSLLDAPPPLNSKMAGYFGRVLGQLLVRKTSEIMAHLQEHPRLLDRLVLHVDTTSITDIVKRIVGADEQSLVTMAPQHAQWLAETPLLDLLLGRLSSADHSASVSANAADILAAIAHTQPSPLATRLMREGCINELFLHALRPPKLVLVPALDVCIALIEPKRLMIDGIGGGGSSSGAVSPISGSSFTDIVQDMTVKAKVEAVKAMLPHVPPLVEYLRSIADPNTVDTVLPTTYGVLRPPLGRPRLKVIELLAVLLRCGDVNAERVLVESGAIATCLELFGRYPFHNLLHNHVTAMLCAALMRSSPALVQHLFTAGGLLDWLVSLPTDVRPEPRSGQEAMAQAKPPLRAGYLGHVMQLGTLLDTLSQPPPPAPPPSQQQQAAGGGIAGGTAAGGTSAGQPPSGPPVAAPTPSSSGFAALLEGVAALPPPRLAAFAGFMESHGVWLSWRSGVLRPRLEVENTQRWACGRPAVTELAGLDSDGDEFQNDMDLEAISGMQPALYHRYQVADEGDDEEDDDPQEGIGITDPDGTYRIVVKGGGGVGGGAYGAQQIAEAISSMDLNFGNDDCYGEELEKDVIPDDHDVHKHVDEEPQSRGGHESTGEVGMEDDEVLLATSDDDELLADGQEAAMVAEGGEGGDEPGGPGGMSDDMVIVEEDVTPAATNVSGAQDLSSSPIKGSTVESASASSNGAPLTGGSEIALNRSPLHQQQHKVVQSPSPTGWSPNKVTY